MMKKEDYRFKRYTFDLMGCMARVDELRKAADEEIRLAKERHRAVLGAYQPAREEMQRLTDAFHAEWDGQIEGYNKEIRAIKKKYNKLAKAAEESFTYPDDEAEKDAAPLSGAERNGESDA